MLPVSNKAERRQVGPWLCRTRWRISRQARGAGLENGPANRVAAER